MSKKEESISTFNLDKKEHIKRHCKNILNKFIVYILHGYRDTSRRYGELVQMFNSYGKS